MSCRIQSREIVTLVDCRVLMELLEEFYVGQPVAKTITIVTGFFERRLS